MKSIQLKTEVPGPNSKALMKRREAAVPRGPYHATPVFAARSEGAMIEDVKNVATYPTPILASLQGRNVRLIATGDARINRAEVGAKRIAADDGLDVVIAVAGNERPDHGQLVRERRQARH